MQSILRNNFTDWKKLCAFLEIEEGAILKNPRFTLNLPKRLAEKIEKGNLNDPILKQFLPTAAETKTSPNFATDPTGCGASRKGKKLLHKYHGRALLLASSACAMHCRFCFRQNFDYETEIKEFDEELELIAQDPSITEIILSGGDPLSLSNQKLKALIQALDNIPHLKRLRFHTRFCIGIPERIDAGLLEILENSRLQTMFVIHCNHPNELDNDILAALKKVQKLGIPVLSHTVLLKGINDDFAVLKKLFNTLSDHGILPYYLNQLDRVQGAMHFEVPQEEGIALMKRLSAHLSGYALPRYIQEIAGEPHKTTII